MSVTATQEEAARNGFNAVFASVYSPALFEKLSADYGIQPRTEAEKQAVLSQAAALRARYDSMQQKSAAQGDPILAALGAQLASPQGPTPGAYEPQIKAAAARGATNPDLAKAVLALLAAQPK